MKKFTKYEKECATECGDLGAINFAEKYDGPRVIPLVGRDSFRNVELRCVLKHAEDAGEDMAKFRDGFADCVKFFGKVPSFVGGLKLGRN